MGDMDDLKEEINLLSSRTVGNETLDSKLMKLESNVYKST